LKSKKPERGPPAKAKPSRKEILDLQEIVLRAVLEGVPLPGSNLAIRFPDLAFLQRQDAIYVAGEEMAGRMISGSAPKAVRIVPVEALRAKAKESPGIAYLQFGRARIEDDNVELTLEGRMAAADPRQPALGLSSVHVRFHKVGGRWEVSGEPVYSAS
jgi:hypothetical protein